MADKPPIDEQILAELRRASDPMHTPRRIVVNILIFLALLVAAAWFIGHH